MATTEDSLIETMVPFYLMPFVAMFGLYFVAAAARTVFLVSRRRSASPQQRRSGGSAASLQSRDFALLFLSLVLSLIVYSFLNARVRAGYLRAAHQSFDPYTLLKLDRPAAADSELAAEDVVAAFKLAVADMKKNQGSTAASDDLQWAYKALTEERSIRNFARFGHPSGELEVPAYRLAVASWLISPVGPYAWAVWTVYGAAVLAALGYTFLCYLDFKQAPPPLTEKDRELDAATDDMLNQASVSERDLTFLLQNLKPDRNHLRILLSVCATPDSLAWSLRDLQRAERMRRERIEKDLEEKSKPKDGPLASKEKETELDLGAMLDEGGWDEDDEDEATKLERKKKEELKKQAEEKAGQKMLFEGMDSGVLGQKWVMNTLQQAGQWPPPKFGFVDNVEYQDGKKGLDHPGLCRTMCMTMGRLNSQMLNGHPALMQASSQKKIDQSYFRASMEFRQRVGFLLEGALRLAMMLRSYRLVCTVVETVALFKLGCRKTPRVQEWFDNVMNQSNGALPRLAVHSTTLKAEEYDEIATGDKCEIELDVERTHAEKFLKAKLAQCEKQGIPPQMVLQSYREGWWMLLRSKRLDGPTLPQKMNMATLKQLKISSDQLRLFAQEKPEEQLMTALPLIVSNIAQQRGKFKLKFEAPSVPGKYKLMVGVRSQDFLGADHELELEMNVLDASKLNRVAKSAPEKPSADKKDT